ncbi:MAG: response regulator [Desulfobacterales bacterium]|nr:response regulator [Desulfobacterales bacterium]
MKKTIKILIVEDEAFLAMFISSVCSNWGYHVCETIPTGEEAIEYVNNKEKPDIILMDIRLAGQMDGITAAEQIKIKNDIPIIFMTGYDEDEIKKRAYKLNPVAYLIKPVNTAQLKALIDSTVK